MEKIFNLNNNEHWLLLEKLFSEINDTKIEVILDAGSGKTSLSALLRFFTNSFVDAIVFPGDSRKKDSIESNVLSNRYELIEKDICKDNITKRYDLVLAHLLLGETIKWGNEFKNIIDKLFNINSKYFIIIDILEDESVDYNYLEQYLLKGNFKIIAKKMITKEEPQKYGNFVGKNYVGYIIMR